jgi:hypothetical protein
MARLGDRPVVPENISLLHLPPYSPELNLVGMGIGAEGWRGLRRSSRRRRNRPFQNPVTIGVPMRVGSVLAPNGVVEVGQRGNAPPPGTDAPFLSTSPVAVKVQTSPAASTIEPPLVGVSTIESGSVVGIGVGGLGASPGLFTT